MPNKLEHAKMTGWYDPIPLLDIGFRAVSSTVFGKMFDKRELMAANDPFDDVDFKKNYCFGQLGVGAGGPLAPGDDEDFWLDYVADTGDGWNPTYAVARLLAEGSLNCNGGLPQGKVLVFGGDQVYPTASRKEYRKRLEGPFHQAQIDAGVVPWTGKRVPLIPGASVFALPGNHDWYDGLAAFSDLFCGRRPARPGVAKQHGRIVCWRETRQTRSYFALELPNNWWLIAFDAQFDGYIDIPQLAFFDHVAQNLMPDRSNVILCADRPSWAYAEGGDLPEGFVNFAYASLVATGQFARSEHMVPATPDSEAISERASGDGHRHNLKLVLAGDAHHFAHFIERGCPHEDHKDKEAVAPEKQKGDPEIHYLTCGLGGAFLHATHWLRTTKITTRWRPPTPLYGCSPRPREPQQDEFGRPLYQRVFELQKTDTYPNPSESRKLMYRNLLFVWLNWKFGILTGMSAAIVTWVFCAGAAPDSLAEQLREGSAFIAFAKIFRTMLAAPWPWLTIAALFGALYYLADNPRHKGKRAAMGGAHLVGHLAVYFLALIALARQDWLPLDDAMLIVASGFAGVVLHPTLLGLYFLIAINGFSRHFNEASSALRIENFKGFLRLRIAPGGKLSAHVIVVDSLPAEANTLPNYRCLKTIHIS